MPMIIRKNRTSQVFPSYNYEAGKSLLIVRPVFVLVHPVFVLVHPVFVLVHPVFVLVRGKFSFKIKALRGV